MLTPESLFAAGNCAMNKKGLTAIVVFGVLALLVSVVAAASPDAAMMRTWVQKM